MPQHCPWSSPFFFAACGLIAALNLGSYGRLAMATNIASPAAVYSLYDPAIVLDMAGDGIIVLPYKWTMQANNFQYVVADTTSNLVPFKILAGSSTDTLCLNGGRVGIGTINPTASLHVLKPAQVSTAEIMARFDISDDSIGKLEIRNGSTTDGIFHPRVRGTTALQAVPLTMEGLITTDAGPNPVVAYDAARLSGGAVVTRPLVIYRNNGVAQVIIGPTGVVTATSFNPVSSRSMKHDITDLGSQEAANALRQLAPVKFIYNDDESNQKRVGFIAEDVPEVVAAPDRQSVPIMDVVALVTRVVKDQDRLNEQQQKTIDQQQKTIKMLTQSNAAQQKRLDALERLMTSKTVSDAPIAP